MLDEADALLRAMWGDSWCLWVSISGAVQLRKSALEATPAEVPKESTSSGGDLRFILETSAGRNGKDLKSAIHIAKWGDP